MPQRPREGDARRTRPARGRRARNRRCRWRRPRAIPPAPATVAPSIRGRRTCDSAPAVIQYCSGGFSKYLRPLSRGVTQSSAHRHFARDLGVAPFVRMQEVAAAEVREPEHGDRGEHRPQRRRAAARWKARTSDTGMRRRRWTMRTRRNSRRADSAILPRAVGCAVRRTRGCVQSWPSCYPRRPPLPPVASVPELRDRHRPCAARPAARSAAARWRHLARPLSRHHHA